MNYEIVENTNFDGSKYEVVIVNLGGGNFKSFPADENNPEYIAFLASKKEEK